MRFLCSSVLAVALLGAGEARAQAAPGQFMITPRASVIRFDRAASLETGGAVGIDAQYQITPMFSVGTNLGVARANTRGEDFLTTLTYGTVERGDTVLFFFLQQPVSIVTAELSATARLPLGERYSPFLTGGVGLYNFYLDPQANQGSARDFRGMSLMVGGGVNIRFSRTAGVQLDVRDLIFTDYDRERLRPSDERFRNRQFLDEGDFPQPPAAKSTVHNLVFTLGFSFTPTRGDQEPVEEEERP